MSADSKAAPVVDLTCICEHEQRMGFAGPRLPPVFSRPAHACRTPVGRWDLSDSVKVSRVVERSPPSPPSTPPRSPEQDAADAAAAALITLNTTTNITRHEKWLHEYLHELDLKLSAQEEYYRSLGKNYASRQRPVASQRAGKSILAVKNCRPGTLNLSARRQMSSKPGRGSSAARGSASIRFGYTKVHSVPVHAGCRLSGRLPGGTLRSTKAVSIMRPGAL